MMRESILERSGRKPVFDVEIKWVRQGVAFERLGAADPAATSMLLWYCGIKDFSFLQGFPRLEVLQVADWLAPTLRDIRRVRGLKALKIASLPKVQDLSPLRSLQELEELYLETLSSSVKKANHFKSLKPICGLPRLWKLRISGAHIDDGIGSLVRLKALERLQLSAWYSLTDVATLAGRRPDVECELFRPYEVCEDFPCKKCGSGTAWLSALPGPRRPIWACPRCKKRYVERFAEEFDRIKAQATRLSAISRRTER